MKTENANIQPTPALLQPRAPGGEEDRVDAVFAMAEEHLGFVPDGLKLYAISPPLLELFFQKVGYFRGGTALSPELTTMIRYQTSSEAGCQFCIDLNESFMVNMGHDLDSVRAARNNADLAPLTEQERVLLKIAVRSNSDPEGIAAADIAAARQAGWSDRHIFDAVEQAASNRAFTQVLRTFKVEHQGVFA